MYKCGHRNGLLLETWPGDWLHIGCVIEEIYWDKPGEFETFRKIANWRLYDDEYLSLPLEEAQLWRLEIEQLQSYLSGKEYMGWKEQMIWDEKWKTNKLLYGSIEETLEKALAACQASLETGNPIEFFW